MTFTKRFVHSIASPIGYPEFSNVLLRALEVAEGIVPHPARNVTLGLAISGGVDSMALAALCRGLTQEHIYRLRQDLAIGFKAFIVDHNARKGSSEEAERVRERLDRMGLAPYVLPLAWPSNVKPLNLSNFETQARRLRYQVLGTACRDHGCHYLMLGHHEDDLAETVMMRLASGHSSRGILGVPLCMDIPECWGIHGVHRSGLLEGKFSELKKMKNRQERAQDPRLKLQALANSVPGRLIFERGGILVLRPLINISKKRLVDTCRANAVDWEEDRTNRESWRTPRNAVRKLFQTFKLPVALRKDSMLALSERNRENMDGQRAIGNYMLNKCHISVFDTRSGKLVVRLPTLELPEVVAHSHTRLRASTAFLLRQLAYSVSPQEHIAFGSMEPAVMSIYPEIFDSDIAKKPMCQPTGFTMGGVHFERLSWSLSKHQTEPRPRDFKNPPPEMEGLNPNFAWRLSRQPFSGQLPCLPIPPPKKNPSLLSENDSELPSTYSTSRSSPWSPWHLWDGRYWIRVLNQSTEHLVVRPLRRSDLHLMEATIGRDRYKALRELLAFAAPDKIRWTLPAIAKVDDSQPHLSQVLAMPTLGSNGNLNVEDEKGHRRVEWQIRYKNFDLSF